MQFKEFKFSIIMPNLNGDKYLEKAIQSFLRLNYANKELIIVDSSSTDNSHSIIAKYENNDTVKWVREKDSSLSDAINIGIKHANGDYIGYMGNDDILLDGFLQKANELLNVMDDIDAFYFDYYIYFKDRNLQGAFGPRGPFTRENLLKIGTVVGLQCVYIKNALLQKYKYNTEYKYAMDYEIYLNILTNEKNSRWLHIDEKNCIVIMDDNLTNLHPEEGKAEIYKASMKYATADEKKCLPVCERGGIRKLFAFDISSSRVFIKIFGLKIVHNLKRKH